MRAAGRAIGPSVGRALAHTMVRAARRVFRARWVRVVVGGCLLALGVGAAGWHWLTRPCPNSCIDAARLTTMTQPEASRVLDRSGRTLGRFAVEDRELTRSSTWPPVLGAAFVAVEDHRFYAHHGVDPWRVAGAVWHNLRARRVVEGFSTITMQLARNLYPDLLPSRDRTWTRKAREIRIARRLEEEFPKSVLLEQYLNTIYFGNGAFGVAAAARVYFGKRVDDLTVADAALLAALPKAPERLNPFRHPEDARRRRTVVLQAMYHVGVLSNAAMRSADAAPLGLLRLPPSPAGSRVAPYFLEAVRRQLAPRYGRDLARRGLQITTTLDSVVQAHADTVLATQLRAVDHGQCRATDDPAGAVAPLQGALIVLDVASGDVLAHIGGRDFDISPFDRATQALRSPGSTFKPFVYAAAVTQGFLADDLVSDEPIAVRLSDGTSWTPDAMDGPSSRGDTITLADALAWSRNRATVRVLIEAGVESVAVLAARAGIRTPIPRVPAIALGGLEVHLLDLVAAYLPFARVDGTTQQPRWIQSVWDPRAQRRTDYPIAPREPALAPDVAREVRTMLEGVVRAGTGAAVRTAGYRGPAFGKTGTTQGATDVWFVGGTPDYVAGIWLGCDRPRALAPGNGATGARLVAPVWGHLMALIQEIPPRQTWDRAPSP